MTAFNESRLQCFRECPCRYYWRYRRGLRKKREHAEALDFGTAVHEGLKVFYRGGTTEQVAEEFSKSLQEKDLEQYGLLMLRGYFTKWERKDRETWEVLATEQELWYDNGTVELGGRLDLVIEDKAVGGIWHVQHKTLAAQSSLERYVQSQEMCEHEKLYRVLWNANHPEQPMTGSLLNLLRKTKEPGFARFNLAFTDRACAEYLEDAEFWKDQIGFCKVVYKDDPWPKNGKSCVDYNRACEFLPLCAGGRFLESEWEEREKDYVDERRKK